ncbi:hypothetical protein M0R89_05255 [Halorussus limi]|uniref:Uncharacterized protein n=1 Tax=Halorussus limi TaxID=2938695 RepID=A0A8U0HXV8_9EURY|nr:hypothetical protein [Halorussus limi]UPV75476.1 hypothetical protein M0R89_05255 [Halorussus limi]
MPTCASCGRDAGDPNYSQKRIEPKADRDGVTVTATTSQRYWMVLCPHCDAVLGTVEDRR